VKGFSTREVAEVLGLPTSKILSWTRSGLLTPERGPKGAYVYSFQDIVLLRAAKELLDSEVPARRVRAALEALREQLPVGRPLSAVHISAIGDRVLVRDEGAVWEPDSGQLRMDFAVAEVAQAAQPIARRTPGTTPRSTSRPSRPRARWRPTSRRSRSSPDTPTRT
jgi:DNA-binding transcriptional MerR regulator